MKILSNIDMNKNEVQNIRVQNLATAPSAPVIGQVYYNTTDNTPYVYDGTSWRDMAQIVDLSTKQDTLVSGTNIKTINGASVLGSGDLSISSGGTYTAGDGISIEDGVISSTNGYLDATTSIYKVSLSNADSAVIGGTTLDKLRVVADTIVSDIDTHYSKADGFVPILVVGMDTSDPLTLDPSGDYFSRLFGVYIMTSWSGSPLSSGTITFTNITPQISIHTMELSSYSQIDLYDRPYINITLDENDGHLSVSDVVISGYDESTTIGNFIDTSVNYSNPYIPLYNGSPATKKYVDDSIGDKQNKLTAGDGISIENNTIANTYGYQDKDLSIYKYTITSDTSTIDALSENASFKELMLNIAKDLKSETHKNIILSIDGGFNVDLGQLDGLYYCIDYGQNVLIQEIFTFKLKSIDPDILSSSFGSKTNISFTSPTEIDVRLVQASKPHVNNLYIEITEGSYKNVNVLETDVDYSTTYTPSYNGSPATKKYVDDNVSSLNDTFVTKTSVGAANGVASLGSDGKVPSSQLPSYVDDVVEGYYYEGKFYTDSEHTNEITPETGKIYVDLTSNNTYRWSGSAYVEISQSSVHKEVKTLTTTSITTGNLELSHGLNTKDVIVSVYDADYNQIIVDVKSYSTSVVRINVVNLPVGTYTIVIVG